MAVTHPAAPKYADAAVLLGTIRSRGDRRVVRARAHWSWQRRHVRS